VSDVPNGMMGCLIRYQNESQNGGIIQPMTRSSEILVGRYFWSRFSQVFGRCSSFQSLSKHVDIIPLCHSTYSMVGALPYFR
jgi:hypothetical protein